MRALRFFLGLLLLATAAGGAAAYWVSLQMTAVGQHSAPVRIEVGRGESLRGVLADLEKAGALENARLVELWARVVDRTPRVKAGRYEINAGASPSEILRQLDEGRVLLESLTIIEGSRYADLRRALAAHPGVIQSLQGVDDSELMRRLGDPGVHPEGRFFPDTYRFAFGTRDLDILRLAHDRLRKELEVAWANRADGVPLANAAEALALASIVEKESALASERPRVAGVFVQRLRRGMRLQSDPTVIYGLGEAYDGDIRSRDLRSDTPYNSYTRKGLPPTPIALPGKGALQAATQPLESGELFFVATGLPDGSHVFSRTYEEHRSAVRQMLQRQRKTPSMTGAESSP